MLLTLISSAILYNQVEIRDINKYKQPAIDEKQDSQIKNISTNQENCRASFEEKNSNTNKRVDEVRDRVMPIEQKIEIMYQLMLRNEKLTSQK